MRKVTLNGAANIITTIGTTNTILVQGRPGIGKSSILKKFDMDKYIHAYIDCANLDLGDLGMPVIMRDVMETHYAPNARFRISEALRTDKPIAVMLDELGKAPKPVMNMLLPVMLERRLADIELPEGSVVFATTNMATDGVGDNIPAHAYNRMTDIVCSGATSDDWCEWAVEAGIEPSLIVFAKQTPRLFQCYTDFKDAANAKENPYIFNPMTGNTRHFVSPRSLHKASHIVAKRSQFLSSHEFVAALEGTIGAPAAADFDAYLLMQDRLASWDDMIRNPETALLPEGTAYFMQAYRIAARVDGSNIAPLMTYVKRWTSNESQALMCKAALQREGMLAVLAKNRAFAELAAKFGRVLG